MIGEQTGEKLFVIPMVALVLTVVEHFQVKTLLKLIEVLRMQLATLLKTLWQVELVIRLRFKLLML